MKYQVLFPLSIYECRLLQPGLALEGLIMESTSKENFRFGTYRSFRINNGVSSYRKFGFATFKSLGVLMVSAPKENLVSPLSRV